MPLLASLTHPQKDTHPFSFSAFPHSFALLFFSSRISEYPKKFHHPFFVRVLISGNAGLHPPFLNIFAHSYFFPLEKKNSKIEMAFKMRKSVVVLVFTLLLLFGGVCSFSAPSSPARIVNGFLSNAFSLLMKRTSSFKTTSKTAMTKRPTVKFEGGYNVETVFDGSKLGIEPYTVQVLPDGDLLILDSANSNLYRISSSLSLYSRPRLVTGSADGYMGHVDGRLREVRMNHPRGLTVDDKGNIYIADVDNMAIRKISETGVTTIAGGKRSRVSGHVDGPSEDAKFSNDFDVMYLGSSCSLLVIDRGNKAVREIQLNFDDCAYQYGSGFPLGTTVLIVAGFFGYMLALLQRRVGSTISSQDDQEIGDEGITQNVFQKPLKSEVMDENTGPNMYQKPLKSSSRPPLVPTEDELEKQEESFTGSLVRLIAKTGESAREMLGGMLPMFKKKRPNQRHQRQQQQQLQYSNAFPSQDSYVIPDEDKPPIETRTPTPKKTYAFMSKDFDKMQQLRQSRAFYSGWDGELQKQTKKSHQHHHHHHHHHQHRSTVPHTYYEQNSEKMNEIVFGPVQEEQGKPQPNMVMKPLDPGMIHSYDHQNLRSRFSHMSGR